MYIIAEFYAFIITFKKNVHVIYYQMYNKLLYNTFIDLSSNRLEPNMEDIPVPSENTFDVTLPAAHSVRICFLIF